MSTKYEIIETDDIGRIDEENMTYVLNTLTMNMTDENGMPSCEFYAEVIEEMGAKKEENKRDIIVSAIDLLSLNSPLEHYEKQNEIVSSEDA